MLEIISVKEAEEIRENEIREKIDRTKEVIINAINQEITRYEVDMNKKCKRRFHLGNMDSGEAHSLADELSNILLKKGYQSNVDVFGGTDIDLGITVEIIFTQIEKKCSAPALLEELLKGDVSESAIDELRTAIEEFKSRLRRGRESVMQNIEKSIKAIVAHPFDVPNSPCEIQGDYESGYATISKKIEECAGIINKKFNSLIVFKDSFIACSYYGDEICGDIPPDVVVVWSYDPFMGHSSRALIITDRIGDKATGVLLRDIAFDRYENASQKIKNCGVQHREIQKYSIEFDGRAWQLSKDQEGMK